MSKQTELALNGGTPVKTTPFGGGPKHLLKEWQAIRNVFERGSIPMTRGPEVMALRQAFCKLTGMKYAVTASSGTAALHTAIGALEIGRTDEVITSPVTDMGTLTAIMAQNAVPVFADIDPLTLMITPETIAAKLSSRTKAVIVVHLAGMAADMRGILRLCKPRKIAVVEDMAQSYLCRQGKRLAGTMGDMSCWSLNESKHIGAGDGGMLLTNRRELAKRADLFADKCYDREGTGLQPFFAPYNYRLNDLVAAVCLEQLKLVKSICARRHRHGARLDAALARIPGIIPRPVPRADYATYWYYIFSVDEEALGVEGAQFAKALQAEGISAQTHSLSVLDWPLFRDNVDNRHACGRHCPLYKGKVDYRAASYPGLERAKRYAIRTPLTEYFTGSDVRDIIRAVRKVADYYRIGLARR
jgi:dTDP-4-amino-4,6-dideoxygalactose transaminase